MPILDWLNKDKAITAAQQVSYRLLQPVPELSVGDVDSGNMLIQGDNLEALKSLLPLYGGKVKCIYIDPPYNTHSAFIDSYDDNLEHSIWLSLMYPRLELLRELLCEDGSIWVTIDDNESHYMKVILDEIFGRNNYITTVAWKSADSSNNDAKQFSIDHNDIHIYSKRAGWLSSPLDRQEKDNLHYKNPDNDPKGPWFSGNVSSPNPRDNLRYKLKTPGGTFINPPNNGWRWSSERMQAMIDTGEVIFSKDESRIIKKTYLANQKGLSPSSIWSDIDQTGHNRQAKYELKKLFSDIPTANLFKTPKPEKLIQHILNICTNENDVVLDSFLGSATTSAVAHKMNRRYIGIEMEKHAVTHCQPRLEKVIDGEQGGISKATNWQGGGGFTFYQLGEPVFDEFGHIREGVSFQAFAQYLWFLETGVPLMTEINSPLLGEHNGKAYYLLYNGILGDRRPQGGNVLTSPILSQLPEFDGPKVIFGESSRLGNARLERERIQFRQIPYEISSH